MRAFTVVALSLVCAVAGADAVVGDGDAASKTLVAGKLAAITTCKLADGRHVHSVGFLVKKDGSVSEVGTQPGPTVEGTQCIQQEIARWTFPKGRDRAMNLVLVWNAGPLQLVQLDVSTAERDAVHSEASEPKSGLDKEDVRKEIRRHLNEVKLCYEKELTKTPDLQGRVMTQFTISGSGKVSGAVVIDSTLGSDAVETCIAHRITTWTFPKPIGGGMVVVRYPFVLKAAGGP